MRFLQFLSVPLLTKELIEQAQNKRTYILRVIYATIFIPALLNYRNISGGGSAAGLVNFGQGHQLFMILWITQIGLVLLLLPPITCGALTVEKEKDTLGLLLLTKLSPGTIIFEKFLSRLFTIATYQLLSLPLFAVVYGIGGVELGELLFSIWSLIALSFVVGSISILCSAWFRTTSAAFVMTYVLLGCLVIGLAPVVVGIQAIHLKSLSNPNGMSFLETFITSLLPWSAVVILGIAVLPVGLTVTCLIAASLILVKRAFVQPRNLVLELFIRADNFFNKLNQQTTGGIVLVPDRGSLPLFDPIAWREREKKSLGTFRYQFRVLMLLLAPLLLAISSVMMENRNDFTGPFRVFPLFFWVVAIICLTIHSTGSIPAERIRQTLDVLLVTPLTQREIVLEKLAGVRRLIKILTLPFGVLVLFQAIWTGYVLRGSNLSTTFSFWGELIMTSLTAIIYMPVIMWLGFNLGLRMRTQIQAVLATFALIGAACAIPIILIVAWDSAAPTGVSEPFPLFAIRWLNPLQVVVGTSDLSRGFDRLTNTYTVEASPVLLSVIVAIHFSVYAALWWYLRWQALRSFSKIVRRMEADGQAVTEDVLTLKQAADSASMAGIVGKIGKVAGQ